MENNTLLARWMASELSESELRELKNSPEYPTLQRIKKQFTLLESPRTNDAGILEEILNTPKSAAKKAIPLYRKTWFAAAAMVVILFGIGLFFYNQPEQLTAAYGKTYAFALPDQSQVLLNAGSKARYKSKSWVNNRDIELDGEAYFKVAKGKKFTVSTPSGKVAVMGTQFNVRSRGKRLDVVCYEGKVSVNCNNQSVILSRGQKITFNNGVTSGMTTTKAIVPEWTHAQLVFENENLAAVLKELERQYDIVLKTNATSAQLFSGSIPGDNLDAALKILCATYHLKVEKIDSGFSLSPI